MGTINVSKDDISDFNTIYFKTKEIRQNFKLWEIKKSAESFPDEASQSSGARQPMAVRDDDLPMRAVRDEDLPMRVMMSLNDSYCSLY